MSTWNEIGIYSGEGGKPHDDGVPPFDTSKWERLHDPARYRADDGLKDAVNVAVTLGMPLLLTGEPGTGKTELAHSIAWEIGAGVPLVFSTKSTSTYTDLFYRYDALRHFQDVQVRKLNLPIDEYITYEALGLAILLAADRKDLALPESYRKTAQRRSVVLIDEIDKAPRDLPNDILNELENMGFEVRELRHTFHAEQSFRPILILTSNLEKDLPEAFRRRCAFYHIEFPANDEQGKVRLRSIIRQRLESVDNYTPEMLSHAVNLFLNIRELKLEKKPSTAELINWVDLLQRIAFDVKEGRQLSGQDYDILAASFALLAKSDEDLRQLRSAFLSPP